MMTIDEKDSECSMVMEESSYSDTLDSSLSKTLISRFDLQIRKESLSDLLNRESWKQNRLMSSISLY